MMKKLKKQQNDFRVDMLTLTKGMVVHFLILLTFALIGCSSGEMEDVVVLRKDAVAGASEKKDRSSDPTLEPSFRAWIKSLSLNPSLPNKDQTLYAKALWGPEGRPIEVSYQWFVNGVEVDRKKRHPEEAHAFSLGRFRSGDRVYFIASLIRPDGSVAASQRSLSTVIQNRPPELKRGLERLVRQDDDLVGQISYADPDGDRVFVKLIDGPKGLILEDGDSIRWPLSLVEAGDHVVTLELLDERGLGFRESFPFSMGVENEVLQ